MTDNLLRDLIHPVGRRVPGCYAATLPLAALRDARSRAYPNDMSWSLRALRLALKPLTTIIKCVAVVFIPAWLAACGGAPVVRQPLAIEQAKAADKEARKAWTDGELLQAREDFEKALALQQSLDDTAGAATTLINLATVSHQLHDDTAALAWLDRILQENERIYPPQSRLAASFRKAVILTDLGRSGEAETSLQSADRMCGNSCDLKPGIDGLRARIQLLNGDAQGALTLSQAVGREGGTDKQEQANALRVAAAAEEKLGSYASALQHFRAALEMDKALGLSSRIAEDLDGLARVSGLSGQEQAAAEYARRAALARAAQ